MIDLGRKRAWYFLWEKISSLTSESITAFMKFITVIRALHHRHEYHRCCRFRSTIWVCRDRHEDQQCYKSPPPLELSISDTRRFSIRLWISVHISSCSHHLQTCISPFWYVQQFISKARLHRHHICIFIGTLVSSSGVRIFHNTRSVLMISIGPATLLDSLPFIHPQHHHIGSRNRWSLTSSSGFSISVRSSVFHLWHWLDHQI